MSVITRAAKGRACTMRLPRVCSHDPEKTVWAHINSVRWGAGKGKKASDLCGLFACAECHAALDGRLKTDHDRDFIKMCAYEGHMESLCILVKEGIIS